MIDFIKKFFGPDAERAPADAAGRDDILVATCALFLEMAEIDGEFDEAECRHIVSLMQTHFELSEDYAVELAKAAQEQRRGSTDLWKFTNLINRNYSREDKIKVVELLWNVVYEDGRMSAHEQYLTTKLRKMLRISHRDLIDAKLRVLKGRGTNG